MASPRTQKTYDHRLRNLVRRTGDLTVATKMGVPRSTAAGWLKDSPRTVVTAEVVSLSEEKLQAEVVRLKRRVERLRAILWLLAGIIQAFGLDLSKRRLPDADAKSILLRAIDRARRVLPLRSALRILNLSGPRYHAWKRAERACEIQDTSSCPRTSPHQMTLDEVRSIREMVTSPQYRHVPTGTLAVLAQRMGCVFASPTTWHKLVRERGWRRPRLRVHPSKPKVGIRAQRPNEIWHIDTTIIRLLDGTKAYIHAVIDNYSRRILSWCVAGSFHPMSTVKILLEASRVSTRGNEVPTVLADGGVENVNGLVDELINSGLLKRVLALTELKFSNSMIESWWRSLKHQWLFLNNLDSVEKVRQLVSFYFDEHNKRLPHSAFRGETPDEMYFGSGRDVPAELAAAKRAARLDRLEMNRKRSCPACEIPDDSAAA